MRFFYKNPSIKLFFYKKKIIFVPCYNNLILMSLNSIQSTPDRISSTFCQEASDIVLALSAHKVGLWTWEPQTDKVTFINDYFKLLDLDETETSTLEQLLNYVHPDDRLLFREQLKGVQNKPGACAAFMHRLIGNGGKIIWVKGQFYSVEKEGNLTEKIICCTINAEAQKTQEHEMQKLSDKYRKLVNLMPDFIFIFDEHFIFQDIIVPDGMSLLHTREELIGSSGRRIFTPAISELYERNIRECICKKEKREIEYYLLIGEVKYYFQARIAPYENNKAFALIRDITNRVRHMEDLLTARKAAEEADRLKSDFLANMSHEIRTPLNAIIGFTEIVAAEPDPDVRAQYMEIIKHNNHLLLSLINDLLDLSRIESGKSKMSFHKTDVRALVTEIETTHKFKMPSGVVFKVDLPVNKGIWVYSDQTRITQILFNLISNAVKNTLEGSITLKVEITGGFLKFSVIDTGVGIPEDKLHTVFRRFEKVQDKSSGTGLGLSICRGLVERLGGEVMLESTLGKGSTFSFTIPYQDTKDHLADVVQEEATGNRKRIMIADESEENFKFVEEILHSNHEAELLWVQNGEEALNTFIMKNPDLVLINMQLPVMSGMDATKRIRAISQDVPVIGVTANAYYMEQQWAMESGCNDVISKPYTASSLEIMMAAFF